MGFPKGYVFARLRNAKDQNTSFQNQGAQKGCRDARKDRGPNCVLSDSGEPKKASGSNYGFPTRRILGPFSGHYHYSCFYLSLATTFLWPLHMESGNL